MKQKLFLACLLAVLSFNVNAQIDVTVNPISLLFGSFNGGADIGFAADMSVEPRVGLNFNKNTIGGVEYSNSGFAFGAIGKYYFGPNRGCDKWHIGPYVDYSTGTLKADNQVDITNSQLGLGLYAGYKLVSSRNIVFDFGIGFGRKLISKYDDGTSTEIDLSDIPLLNISATGKLAVGYRFGSGKN